MLKLLNAIISSFKAFLEENFLSEIKTQKPADVTAKVNLKKSNPKEYYASSSLSFKAPVPPFHPFCRCQMIPKYAGEYSKPKLNADADKEYLQGLKEWQRARILGSKRGADEALKTGDINSVFNAMKPERYKVKSIDEVAKFQKQNGTTPPLKEPDEVNKANKVNEVAKFQKESDIISPLNKVNEMIFLDEISQNEAIKIMGNYLKTDLELAKSRRNFIISKNVKQYLKDIFKNENLHSIILSEETLAQHFLKHPEVTANDYYFVLKSLAKKPLANFESGKNNQLFYYDNSEKIYYRIAIKATKNDEIFVKSAVKGDEKLYKEIKNRK
ncbi:MAG: hypothetical protein MR931_02120 [Campylobacter sp.]|nr:hypothetical protein [Campylobacter sp.]